MVAAYPGPVITRYEIEPAVGVKGAQIVNLAKDLARALSLVSIRVVETIPGKNYMGLELPNPKRQIVRLSEILGSQVYDDARVAADARRSARTSPATRSSPTWRKMPHLLVAGTTGSGKSVGINAMILSLLYKAEARDVRLILIDPKMLELSRLRRHPAPARAGGHRHEAGGQRAQLVRRRDGAALQADEQARRAQPRRLQPARSPRPRSAASTLANPFTPDARAARAAASGCRSSSSSSTSSPT